MIAPKVKRLEERLKALGYQQSATEGTLRLIGFIDKVGSEDEQLRLWQTKYQSNQQFVIEAMENVIRALASRGHKKI